MTRVRTSSALATALATTLALTAAWATPPDDEVASPIDVSGRRGQDGRDGANGWGSGADGGDAGHSTAGQAAGSLDLTLEPGPDGRFVVRGRVRPAGSALTAPLERDEALGRVVPLLARGGAGGHGGDGGDGATGSTGSDGSDATCYSSGGSGGRGGDGGNGGSATSGSDGGAGGDVTIRVGAADTHLLLLVDPDNRGGKGGAPGSHGRGGAGGAGGAGGRSHSSHGSGNNRCSGRSGGSRGSSGSRGLDGWGSVARGDDAPAGRLVYVVDGVEHPDRYRLELVGFELVSHDDDGVFEPGEDAIVRGVTARNRGHVATPPPALHETRVYLPLTRNVSAPTAPILLPVSLTHEQTAALPGALRFTIPDIDVDRVVRPNVRYEDEGLADPRAHVADARRDHPEFVNPTRFPVGFPLVLRPVQFGSAMGPGETRRIVLEVENVSTRPLGREVEAWLTARGEPLDPARRRGIHVTFGFEGRTLSADDLVLVDPDGDRVDLARGRFTWEIDALGPGEVARCEVSLGLRPEAEPYAGGDLAVDLHLGRLGQPADDRRVIERRRLPVRVAARWQRPARPSLLLVTNVGVERDVVSAWRALAGGLGYDLAIWDLSYYGFLPLGARREGRADALLMDDVGGHLAVVLGNAFESPIVDDAGVPRATQAASFLSPDEVVRAATSTGLRALVVGPGLALTNEPTCRAGGRELEPWRDATRWRGERVSVAQVTSAAQAVAAVTTASVADLLAPTAPPARVVDHASVADLLEALAGDAVDVHAPDVAHRAPLEEGWFWGSPRRYRVATLVEDLRDALASRWPDRRYLIVSRVDPALEDGALWNTIRHGFAEVRRLPDGGVDALQVPPDRLGRAEYVADPQVLEAVLRALPFERKLELLTRFLEGELPAAVEGAPLVDADGLGRALSRAVVFDLSHEVSRWRAHAWSGLSTAGDYRARLTRHAALARLTLTRPLAVAADADPRAACALRIAAGSEAMAEDLWGPEDVLVPLAARRYFVATAIAGTLGDGLSDAFLRAVFGPEADTSAALEAELAPLRRRLGGWTTPSSVGAPSGEWPVWTAAQVHRDAGNLAFTIEELFMQQAIEADRGARRAEFLEALDRLRVRTELSEGLSPR